MHRMLNAAFLFGTLAISQGSLVWTQSSAPVVGVWLGEARSKGGLGNWLEFRPDGTVVMGFGALVDGRYRFDKSTLWVEPRNQPGRESPVGELVVKGDTAVRRPRPPADAPPRESLPPDQRAMLDRLTQPITMTRVGKASPGAEAIVGTWTYDHPSGGTAYETFTGDGKTFLRVRMQAVEGTYTSTAGRILVTLPNGSDLVLVPNGDVLVSQPKDDGREGNPRPVGNVFRRLPE